MSGRKYINLPMNRFMKIFAAIVVPTSIGSVYFFNQQCKENEEQRRRYEEDRREWKAKINKPIERQVLHPYTWKVIENKRPRSIDDSSPEIETSSLRGFSNNPSGTDVLRLSLITSGVRRRRKEVHESDHILMEKFRALDILEEDLSKIPSSANSHIGKRNKIIYHMAEIAQDINDKLDNSPAYTCNGAVLQIVASGPELKSLFQDAHVFEK